MWRLHKGENCKKAAAKGKPAETKKTNTASEDSQPKKRVRFSKALEARFKALEVAITNDGANNDDDIGPHQDDAFDYK